MVTEQVTLGRLGFDFTRMADPDRVLDEVAAEADLRDRLAGERAPGDELHLPYWAELWDSARGMGQFLVDHFPPGSEPPMGQVLDLGCGMGMSGTVAAALGCRVLFADLEPPALLFAQLNSAPWRPRVRTRRTNWQRDRLGESFELILGADILYERAQWPFLDAFWREHLAPGGSVLLGEPGRQTGDLFTEWIIQRRWRLELFEVPVPTRPRPIRLLQLKNSIS